MIPTISPRVACPMLTAHLHSPVHIPPIQPRDGGGIDYDGCSHPTTSSSCTMTRLMRTECPMKTALRKTRTRPTAKSRPWRCQFSPHENEVSRKKAHHHPQYCLETLFSYIWRTAGRMGSSALLPQLPLSPRAAPPTTLRRPSPIYLHSHPSPSTMIRHLRLRSDIPYPKFTSGRGFV